ncbi:MAG: TetR/AcrR family transcriptional regulator [Pseudomonadales bacterium]
MTARTEDPYHHGDLRETLLRDALQEIAAAGTEKLSLRALARRAGVSPTAPYRHFPSKRCLLAALITRGFRLLDESISAARKAAGSDLESQLVAMSLAYVRFAQHNPTYYELMFSTVLEDFSEYEDLQQAAEASYGVLLSALEDLVAARPGLDISASELSAVVWSAVHGVASLLLFSHGRAPAKGRGDPLTGLELLAEDPERGIRLLLRGVLSA